MDSSSFDFKIFSKNIENIDRTLVCRFCLVNAKKASRKYEIKTIAQIFKTLTDVDLILSSDYPTFVCSTCERNLRIAAKTRNDVLQMENCWKKFIEEMPLIEEIKIEEVDVEDISFETVEMVIEPIYTSSACEDIDDDDYNVSKSGFEMKVQDNMFEDDDRSSGNFESYNVRTATESLCSDGPHSDTVFGTPKNIGQNNCKYCEVTDLTRSELRKHRLDAHPKMTEDPHFTCDICHKTYSSRYGIHTHMKRHAQELSSEIQSLRYKCSDCDKTFSRKSHLKEHESIHSGIFLHICHICGIGKKSRHLMNNHLKSHNANYSPPSKPKSSKRYYTCWLCPKRIDFKTLEELKNHRKNLHHKFECVFCKNGFMTNKALQSHILIHRTQDRPHVCKICGGTFSKIGHLNSHIQGKHALQKPYPCDRCEKGFVHRYQLESHIRIFHDKIKAFKCTECSLSFGHSKSRVLHMRTVHKADM